ncbi:phosphotransferase family protein [Nocardioides nematodiphilus]|uniref:phosphotransferase family protein n=1 Tax=Nocardioides nematodiphilus TaxID=2849669 RepID=UPI001CDA08B0|nr:phosphotransferase family protein [Nocardioides nematodiphilus]MCA1981276.1 phosphotransferase family protein [Nocardioides nematodiphilus]
MTQDLPGLDLTALTAWWPDHVGPLAGGLSATLIAGGKSNLTYQVTDGARGWIVRRPPLGHVLATAHDMAREYRVMTALRDTEVPVPTTYALCEDLAILGAPFYVMDRVEGTPYRLAEELAPLGAERVRAITTRLVDTLAALHRIDPVSVGLGDFGRAEGFLARQVARWKKQLDASHSRDLPAAEELYARLSAGVPPESAPGIVHGDYRLDNVLIDATPERGDRLTAVLDWEMATLGDPLTDLALMLLYQRLGAAAGALVSDVAAAPGYLTEDEILTRYAAGGGRDLTHFGFYLGLAAFKLAAILEGIHYRYLQGQTVGPGFDHIGEAIHPLLAAGLDALDN